jgi:hypothetical protein
LARRLIIPGFAVGVLFVLAVFVLSNLVPNPSKTAFEINRIVLALGAAGFALALTGMLTLSISNAALGLSIQAAGALAVLVIVYFFAPNSGVIPNPGVRLQGTLGTLIKLSRRDPGSSTPNITFAKGSEKADSLWIPEVDARSWKELIARICATTTCIACSFDQAQNKVTISIKGQLKEYADPNGAKFVRCA